MANGFGSLYVGASGLQTQQNALNVVANNLAKNELAHVALASALCVVDIPEYPTGDFGKAIFDIDPFDNPGN